MQVSSKASQPLVLVVDDSEDARTIFTEYLEFRGFRCATAEDGLEALTSAGQLLPDVILMDLALPVLDGCESTRRLKRAARTRDIPVIAITAFDSKKIFKAAREAGCVTVIPKPVEPHIIEMEVRRVLARNGDTPAYEGPQPQRRPA